MKNYPWKGYILGFLVIGMVAFSQITYSGVVRKAFAIGETATPLPNQTLDYKRLLQIPPIRIHDYPAPVAWLGWSPGAKWLSVVYEDDHKIRLLDSTKGKMEYSVDVPEATVRGAFNLAWSPDGKYLAGSFDITYAPNSILKIWSVLDNSAKLINTITFQAAEVRELPGVQTVPSSPVFIFRVPSTAVCSQSGTLRQERY